MPKASPNGANGSSRLRASDSPRVAGIRLGAIIFAGVLLLTAASSFLLGDDETREIRALPPPQRQVLYQRTMENLKAICDPAPGRSMRDFCRNQASLALKFNECDDDCRRTARRHLSLPRP